MKDIGMRFLRVYVSLSALALAPGCANDASSLPGKAAAPAAETSAGAVSIGVPQTPPPNPRALAVRDRIQAHYFTTLVKIADKVTLSRGRAELEIRYDVTEPRVTLKLEAAGPSDRWTATLPLLEASALAAKVEQTFSGSARIRHQHGAELVSEVSPARLTVERSKDPGKRATFHGRLLDEHGATTAEFESELSISCLVPPEVLGMPSNGHPETAAAGAVLVNDQDLQSAFCAKFSTLL